MAPAIRTLRNRLPQAKISMLTDEPYIDLVNQNPHLDEVLTVNRKNKGLQPNLQLINQLRSKKFDVVLDFQRKFGTSLISWLTQAKIRVGFHRPNGYLLTIPVEINRHNRQHVIDDYFQLLEVVGIQADDRKLELHVSRENRAFAEQKIEQESVASPGATVGLFPGASSHVSRSTRGAVASPAIYRNWPSLYPRVSRKNSSLWQLGRKRVVRTYFRANWGLCNVSCGRIPLGSTGRFYRAL